MPFRNPPRTVRNPQVIEQAWHGYKAMVLPKTATPEQIETARLAYFAGAAVLFYSILFMLDEGEDPTTADLGRMDALHREIETFAKTFDMEAYLSKVQATRQ